MINITDKKLNNFTFIDLFAGIGGFRLALESFGARCIFSSEIDEEAIKVYSRNFKDKPSGDITSTNLEIIPNHDILCAGFPCQPFSISGKRLGFNDTRGTLFFEIEKIIKIKKPKIILLENVKNLLRHDNGKTFNTIINKIKNLGYSVFYKVLNASNYGVPQHRERLYIVAFAKDLDITEFSFPKQIELKQFVRDLLMNNNASSTITSFPLENVKFTKNDINYCVNKPYKIGFVNKGGQGERVYSIFGTAITLSANGGGKFSRTGGYYVNGIIRKLYPRECARLMGFPDSFIISENNNSAYRQFGNAVVVDVLQYIIKNITAILKNNN